MGTIINHAEQCIEILHFILPVGKSKNYCRSYEFRQIICPLNKHSQNKHNLVRFLEFKLLKLISTTTVFIVIITIEINKIPWNNEG